MRKLFLASLILSIGIVGIFQPGAQADRTFYTVSTPNDGGPNLMIVNPLTATTVAVIPITLSGFSVLGANGLARDPTTGMLWALLQVTSDANRRLVTISSVTGIATLVGDTGDNFAGLAFTSNGTLYGITGDGGNVPETLHTLNKTTGAATAVKTLGNGNDGEAIGFNPNTGLIYHASGNDTFFTRQPAAQVFESIDPANLAAVPVNISRSGYDYEEALALAYGGGNTFLLSDGATASPRLATITAGGIATLLGDMDHEAKGLAFVPKPPVDFDRDTKNDIAIYRSGIWWIRQSSNGAVVGVGLGGLAQDIPVQADYDGDGKTDQAVYRNGIWWIRQSSNGAVVGVGLGGLAQDMPVSADYDGDGKTDQAVYRDGIWWIRQSSNGAVAGVGFGGLSNDIPLN